MSDTIDTEKSVPHRTLDNNSDPREIDKFNQHAQRWWDANGDLKTLHDINPLRLEFIKQHAQLNDAENNQNLSVIDIGCGGGILSEGLAAQGLQVTGVDMAAEALNVARLHLLESGHKIDYIHGTAEEVATQAPGQYAMVTCMELLEHVPTPASLITACSQLVKPGGHVFFSTLNRTPKAYILAIVGAEYVMRLLPRGTHEYAKFIRPSELSHWCREAGLTVRALSGMHYNPITRHATLSKDVGVNYLVHAVKT